MAYAILSAQTGHGHKSVMNTLYKEFKRQGINDIVCYESFYEDMMLSNKILSNFYNFLMINSLALCNQYCEFTYLTRYDLSEDFYDGVKNYVTNFLLKNKFDIIISVSHTINAVMIRLIKELELSTKFIIVVTDPFDPIAVGFDVSGAEKYYVANEVVKNVLQRRHLDDDRIEIVGYPIAEEYSPKRIKRELKSTSILINSGSQGIQSFFMYLKLLCEQTNYDLIFICGKNIALYQKCLRYIKKNNFSSRVTLLQYIENVYDYIVNAEIVITKAGANSFFEALALKTPVLIDSQYMIFQERGVRNFLSKYHVGEMMDDPKMCASLILDMLNNISWYKSNIEDLDLSNGARNIVDSINKMSVV